MSKIVLAARVCGYKEFGEEAAFRHMAEAGIKNIEIAPPEPGAAAARQAELRGYGLEITSLATACDVLVPESADKLFEAFVAAESLGVGIVFVSARAPEPIDWPACVEALRRIGDQARNRGVIVSIETHPPFAHNGDIALEAMTRVDHPAVRINFDTANVYYYNQGVDGVEELKKIAPFVASVHLKDANGGFKEHNFPTLGLGIVDFPAAFRIMGERGFTGPYTLELEGIAGEELTLEQTGRRILESVEYLKREKLV